MDTPHVCIEKSMTEEMLEKTPMPFSPRYYATVIMDGKVLLRGCGQIASNSAPVMEEETTEGESLTSAQVERVCIRIEGCGINPIAMTEEEYFPTCVLKSKLKKE